MKNTSTPVIVQRITRHPSPADMAIGMLQGVQPETQSIWVAVGINTAEVIAQDSDKAKLLEALAQKGNYKVKQIINDWN
jgi:hypothetical protein